MLPLCEVEHGTAWCRLKIWKLGKRRIDEGKKGHDVPYAEGKIMTFTCF